MTQVRREPVGMASGSGPRAKGTDGADHKFRQRVDDHYKLMADGRAKLAPQRSHSSAAAALLVCLLCVLASSPQEPLVAGLAGLSSLPALLGCAAGVLGANRLSARL